MKKIIITLIITVITGCVTTTEITYPDVSGLLEKGNFQEALKQVDNEQKTLGLQSVYNNKNNISFHMDRGLLAHYSGDYETSFRDLQEAQQLIEEAFTESVSDNFAATVTNNPYNKDYAGEDFENIYVNIFSALNFYQNGDMESAMVEIRQLNNKLAYIRDSYAAMDKRNSAMFNMLMEWQGFFGEEINYESSALARYLGMLFWRGMGSIDDARIDAQEITNAYEASKLIYSTPLPAELVMENGLCEELSIPSGMARINFLAFTGLSPYKVPVSTNEFRYHVSTFNGHSMPSRPPHAGLAFRHSPVERIEIVFDNGRKESLSVLEDMGRVTQHVFESRDARKSMLALYKAAFNPLSGVESSFMSIQKAYSINPFDFTPKTLEKEFVTAGDIVKKKIAEEEKSVDTRMTRFLPEKAYIGGINLDPGVYSFTVNYYSADSIINSRRVENYNAEEGALNLVEDFYLDYQETLPPLVLPADSQDSNSMFYFRSLYNYSRDSFEYTDISNPPDNITFLKTFFDEGNIGSNLPNFSGRLPAPKTDLTHDWATGIYRLTWEPVPRAYRYYVYWVHDGNAYLTWVESRDHVSLKMPPSFGKPDFKVMAVGPDGFGIPSR